MVEIWKKPTDRELERLREAYGDNIVFATTYHVLEALNKLDVKDIDFLQEDMNKWCEITRRIIFNGHYLWMEIKLNDIMEAVNEQRMDEYESNIPETKEYMYNIKRDPSVAEGVSKGIKITEIAKKFGLKLKGEMAICPFHADKDPSLSLSDKLGTFHCFGCNEKGDYIKFYTMLAELKKKGKLNGNVSE